MQAVFGVDGECASALLISFVGGYPVGISCVTSLYEASVITKKDAEQAILFCNNSGPGFFVGVVGATVLRSVRLGLILYFIHMISAIAVGRLLCRSRPSMVTIRRQAVHQETTSQQFLNAITSASSSLLQVCALIVFFCVFLEMIECIGILSLLHGLPIGLTKQQLSAAIYGTLELTGGILRLNDSSFVAAAFFMSWGGVCVHFQAMSFWRKAGLMPKGYYFAKLLHAFISALLAYCYLNPNAIGVFILCLLGAVCVIFPQIRKKVGRNPLRFAL